jgi:hypothetical protein
MLYLDFCDFYRFPVIDAAVILAEGGCRLFVNPFARPDIVRATRLYRFLDERGAVADPVNQEAAGEVYVVDSSDIDRRDEKPSWPTSGRSTALKVRSSRFDR